MEKKWTVRVAHKDTNGPCEWEGEALLERKIFHKPDQVCDNFTLLRASQR